MFSECTVCLRDCVKSGCVAWIFLSLPPVNFLSLNELDGKAFRLHSLSSRLARVYFLYELPCDEMAILLA